MSEPTVNTPITNTEPAQNTEPAVMTFDEMLATNGYQAEFDKRLTKAQNTNAKTLQAQFEETLNARNADLEALKEQLKGFEGTDAAFKELQVKYDTESKQMQAQLQKQAYEFAVKDATSGLKFSSKAAKDYFINKAIEKGLTMGDSGILGFDDFVNEYKTADPEAFIIDTPKEPETKPAPTFTKPAEPTPMENSAFSFLRGMAGVNTPINKIKRE